MSITSSQNSNENINLLAAQRFLYAKAKNIRTFRIVCSLIFALIIAPITIIIIPEIKIIVGIISSRWVVIVFLLTHFENRLIRNAATIQEQFDTSVFDMRWNKFLVGNKISPEIIVSANRKYKGERKKLENWYGDISNIPHSFAVLLCQRSNLVWDWRLRRYLAWTILIFLLILTGVEGSIAYYFNISSQVFFLGLFLPSISFIIIALRELKEHFEIADNKEKLEGQLTNLLNQFVDGDSIGSDNDTRQIQDKIFELRKRAVLIPDWWYSILKIDFENDMQSSIDMYKEKLNH